jgi:hypothetical protein
MTIYRLPDGSDDTPDENGQHTKTINVLHSAKEAKRFWGCQGCAGCAESDRIGALVVSHYPANGKPWYTIGGLDARFDDYCAAARVVRQMQSSN